MEDKLQYTSDPVSHSRVCSIRRSILRSLIKWCPLYRSHYPTKSRIEIFIFENYHNILCSRHYSTIEPQEGLPSRRQTIMLSIVASMILEVFVDLKESSFGRHHRWKPRNLAKYYLSQNFGSRWQLLLGRVSANCQLLLPGKCQD